LKLIVFLAGCALTAPALAASAEDPALNAVYAGLRDARAAHDVAGMAAAFAQDGLLVDARPGPVISGAELPGRLAPMAQRIRDEGVRIATAYRLERRSVMGDVAVDAGFMRQTMVRATGEQAVRHARFLVTLRRQSDGRWRIVADASMPATAEAFDALKPVEGLHYDA